MRRVEGCKLCVGVRMLLLLVPNAHLSLSNPKFPHNVNMPRQTRYPLPPFVPRAHECDE